jgi:hypothetical protein
MHTEGHDLGKPEGVPAHPAHKRDAEHPGYETQDVNVGGIVYFLGGLSGFLLVFFFLCFFLGRVINFYFVNADGAPDKWHPYSATRTLERQNLTPNPVLQQKELDAVTRSFPTPRVVADDDNQETADLHAREDLLLEHYSTDTTGNATTTRIPIDRAMELIAERGLGAAPAAAAAPVTLMAGDARPQVQAPLTNGFARTGYELDQIETREQKMNYESARARAKE